MKELKNTKTLIITALFAALCCAATMVIRIPTPTMGYVHPGDAIVLLSGLLLGPVAGGLAAGIGSCFADIFGGYFTYAPATFLIKAMCAILAYYVSMGLSHKITSSDKKHLASIIPAGIIAEIFMVVGYFIYEIFLLGFMAGGISGASLSAGMAAAAGGVLFNVVQGAVGIALAFVLYPILNPIYNKVNTD